MRQLVNPGSNEPLSFWMEEQKAFMVAAASSMAALVSIGTSDPKSSPFENDDGGDTT